MRLPATPLIGMLLTATIVVAVKASGIVVTPLVAASIIGGFCVLVFSLAVVSKWRHLTAKHRDRIDQARRKLMSSPTDSGISPIPQPR